MHILLLYSIGYKGVVGTAHIEGKRSHKGMNAKKLGSLGPAQRLLITSTLNRLGLGVYVKGIPHSSILRNGI